MIKRRIASVDQDTGEVLEGVVVYCGIKHNPYTKGWVMNSQDAMESLSKDKDIKGETHRIIWYLLSRLDFENWIQITQKEISEELGINKVNVSKAITLLEEKELIVRGPKLGRTYAFRLNPLFGWKGKVRNLDDYRKEQENREHKELKEKHLKVIDTPPKTDKFE
jgi:transcription initiation factor IIE alpha subunit